jgi:zinc transport system permease protein
MSFWEDLLDPDFPLLRHALLLGWLVAPAVGLVGSLVVARRTTYLAAAIAHASLGGIGLTLYLRHHLGWPWMTPQVGAIFGALVAAWMTGWIARRHAERTDALISAIWASGMAAGLLLVAKTPGAIDPMSALFGDILLISEPDLWLTTALAVVIVGLGTAWFRDLELAGFDPDFAQLRGTQQMRLELSLMTLIALTVALLVQMVGIVLAIALISLPASTAGRFFKTLPVMAVAATVGCGLIASIGIAASYLLDLPSGPMIVLTGATVYGLSLMRTPH